MGRDITYAELFMLASRLPDRLPDGSDASRTRGAVLNALYAAASHTPRPRWRGRHLYLFADDSVAVSGIDFDEPPQVVEDEELDEIRAAGLLDQ